MPVNQQNTAGTAAFCGEIPIIINVLRVRLKMQQGRPTEGRICGKMGNSPLHYFAEHQ
jgi:hypothetical protein